MPHLRALAQHFVAQVAQLLHALGKDAGLADIGIRAIGCACHVRPPLGIRHREVDRAGEIVEHLIGKRQRNKFVRVGNDTVGHALAHPPFEQAIDRQGAHIGDKLSFLGGQRGACADFRGD